MNKVLLTAFTSLLVTAGASSAMAYSSDYGNPALFGNVEAPAATNSLDAGYPPVTHSKLGDLSLYGPVDSGGGQFVSVPLGAAVGFTQDFGDRTTVRIPKDPAGTSGLRLR